MKNKNYNKFIIEYNKTQGARRNSNLIFIFSKQVKKNPDAIAIKFNQRVLSYRSLDQYSDKIAYYLQNNSNGNNLIGRHIAFALDRSDKTIAVIIAILKIGACYVPFDPSQPDERLQYILSDCDIALFLTERKYQGRQQDYLELYLDDISESLTEHIYFPVIETKDSDIAYIMYTSGSTGKPKGVLVPQKGIFRLLAEKNGIPINTESVVAQVGNIAFDASTFEIWGALLQGACLIILPYEQVIDFRALVQAFKHYHISHTVLTVALFNQLAQENVNAFAGIQHLIIAGDALNPKIITTVFNAEQAPQHIWNGYGPTECTVCATLHAITHEDCTQSSIPIGRPIADTCCYVLDKQLQPLPTGVIGELYLSGSGIAEGYLGQAEKTAEAFITNPFYADEEVRQQTPATATLYKTGDRVRWLENGCLEFIGRTDNQVKIRGYRLELGEVENHLLKLKQVEQAVVQTMMINGQKQLVAHCISRVTQSEILNAFKQQVPTYMVPARLIVMARFPLTANGKVDKKNLPKPDCTLVADEYQAPQNQIESMLATIWQQILDLPTSISRLANFFDLGGHSLLLVKVQQQLQTQLHVAPTLSSFFSFPVLADLATQIQILLNRPFGKKFRPIEKLALPGNLIPLSAEQTRLWWTEKSQAPSAMYHVSAAFHITQALNLDALQAAFTQLIDRHHSLRSRIVEYQGQAYQQVVNLKFDLPLILLENEQQVQQAIQQQIKQPFDFSSQTLLRIRVYQWIPQTWVLAINLHHIITDGWSMGNFYRELALLYRQELTTIKAKLTPLTIQFTDYCLWQHDHNFAADHNYWLSQLTGVTPLALQNLQTTHTGSTETEFHSIILAPELRQQLEAQAAHCHTGLYNILYSALALLLARYCNQTDIPIAGIWANRPFEKLSGQIGFFANTLILRCKVDEHLSVQDLLTQNHAMLVDAFEHGAAPLSEILAKLPMPRTTNQHPLTAIVLVLQNTDGGDGKGLNLEHSKIEHYPLPPEPAKCDLVLNVLPLTEGTLKIEALFRKSLWNKIITDSLLTHYCQILDAFTSLLPMLKTISLPEIYEAVDEPLKFISRMDKQVKTRKHSVKLAESETEKVLIRIWQQLLNTSISINVDDNFFEIGGHSLLIFKMAELIEKYLGQKIDVTTLFTTQHLGDLALKIDGKAIKQNNVIQQSVEQDQWLANTRPYLSEPSVNFETILLTGATGFLGIYLLSQLQQSLPNSITYCLIRANNEVTAQEKLQANATHYRLNIDFKRIIILLGDLKQENLGLNSSQWQNIVIQIDAIYHCGAQLNHLYHYFSLRHANVSSTLTLLALCQQGRKKQFFYISTLSTALQQGNLIEENCVANAPPKENGYIQSKWIAERLIQQAFAQGLYGTIYRMGNITGCTRYGYSNTENNHGLSVIKGCLQQGIAPLWKYYDVDITPVDKVADLLVQSSINGLHAKQCVNLSYLTSLPWVEILQQIANDASPIEFVSPGEWAKIWVPKIKQGNALYFFKSFYLQTEERPKIIVERNYVKQVNLPLDGMKLLSLYRQYWQKTGFITRNLIEISCARRVAVK